MMHSPHGPVARAVCFGENEYAVGVGVTRCARALGRARAGASLTGSRPRSRRDGDSLKCQIFVANVHKIV
uniref:Uncharacterized protein n=1 Tax=Pararge aegeria TaxID=116150 RepID=S4NVE2_9NEOP